MIPGNLLQCFLWDGYNKARVHQDGLTVFYRFIEDEAYAVALYDFEACGFTAAEQVMDCAGNIKSSFYHQSSTSKVNLLQIFCINDGQDVKDLCYNFDETWVYEVDSLRLIIYENQKGEFLNVRQLIEQGDKKGKEEITGKKPFYPISTFILVAVNILFFILTELTGGTDDIMHMVDWGAMWPEYFFERREYYRLVTEMFLHFGPAHLLNNMLVLFIMGKTLEKYVGNVMFFCYYMVSGIIAGAVSLFYHTFATSPAVSAGASGAVFGIIGVMFFLVIKNKGRLEGFTSQRMWAYLVLSFCTGMANPSIDYAAHAGGFAGGVIMALCVSAVAGLKKMTKRR